MGGYAVQNSKYMGGSALNFQKRKTAKSSLEIADLLTFLICNKAQTDCRSWIQINQAGVSVHVDEQADGPCSKCHIEKDLKLTNKLID